MLKIHKAHLLMLNICWNYCTNINYADIFMHCTELPASLTCVREDESSKK
jgi:hypothetical protein